MAHLTFSEHARIEKMKTQVWNVYGYKEVFLGTIQWSNGWREYVFLPCSLPTQWSPSCLAELAEFLQRKTTKHRENWKKKKVSS